MAEQLPTAGGRLNPTPEVQEFLADLQTAPFDAWRRIPGLGGPFRTRHTQKGLSTGAIVLHVSGRGFGWATLDGQYERGGKCPVMPRTYYMLQAEIDADDRAGPRMNAESTKALLTTYKRMGFGLEAPKVAASPSLEFDL